MSEQEHFAHLEMVDPSGENPWACMTRALVREVTQAARDEGLPPPSLFELVMAAIARGAELGSIDPAWCLPYLRQRLGACWPEQEALLRQWQGAHPL